MPDADLQRLRRLADGLIAAGSRGRAVERVGPFVALIAQSSDAYLMSLAVPVEAADDWRPRIEQLDAHFQAHRRTTRLEFFEELHPTLAPALEAAGMVRQMTAPAMVCTPESFRPPLRRLRRGEAGRGAHDSRPEEAGDVEARFALLGADDASGLDALVALQAEAFGMPLPTVQAWQPSLEAGLADGMVMAGIVRVGGLAAAGATLLVGGDVAELAGVATLPALRRRGLAAWACGELMARYFARGGALCWLSAEPQAQALYAGLGFEVVGTQLNVGRSGQAT